MCSILYVVGRFLLRFVVQSARVCVDLCASAGKATHQGYMFRVPIPDVVAALPRTSPQNDPRLLVIVEVCNSESREMLDGIDKPAFIQVRRSLPPPRLLSHQDPHIIHIITSSTTSSSLPSLSSLLVGRAGQSSPLAVLVGVGADSGVSGRRGCFPIRDSLALACSFQWREQSIGEERHSNILFQAAQMVRDAFGSPLAQHIGFCDFIRAISCLSRPSVMTKHCPR